MVVVEPPLVSFAGLLRQLRAEAGLTQEELAAAAGLSARSVSDLERGVALTARKDTARLLADALNLEGAVRASFEAVARGRALAGGSPSPDPKVDGVTAAAAAMTRALPRDIASFTGREPELKQLVGVTAGALRSGGVVGIHAIGGMAGIGKTTLAVHAAHQLASRFPDGQIFLPLHGHTPGQQPVDPADALASLLLTAGVPAAKIPPGLEARTALWRDRLAGKQLLLVLDDAAGSEQVRPLLPGTAGSLVLVTSRRHLTALEDARAVSLGTLAAGEAAELLIRLAARPGLELGDAAVVQITRLCGYLPLAVGMLARQLHHHPAWTAAELAAELAAARDRLELMHAENLSVAAAFDLSYADLTRGQQRLFRRLGLHPGPDVDAYAAAALDGTDLVAARRHLDALYDHHLIDEPVRGRYRLHDLIREHARTLASMDRPSDNDGATGRLLDYYLDTAAITETRLATRSRPRPATVGPAGPLAAVPELPDRPRALAWARAERANLLACLDDVTRTGQHARVVALTAAMAPFLYQDGPWADAITRHTTAIQAARHLGDRRGEAGAHNDLGDVRLVASDYPGATQALAEALDIYRDLGDRIGEANALNLLGAVRWLTGNYPAATQALGDALGIYLDLGDRLGEANILLDVGAVRSLTGDYPGSIQAADEALAIHRDLGNRYGEAGALLSLGTARCDEGDYPGATQALQDAMDICLSLGDRLGRAIALIDLGYVRQMTGDYAGATQALEEGLSISLDLGDRLCEANALNHYGIVRRMGGDYPGATQVLEKALRIYLDLGARDAQAMALLQLAAVRRMTGDHPGAAQAVEEALGTFRDLGDRGGEAEALNEMGALHQVRGNPDRAKEYHQQALALARETSSSWVEADSIGGLGRCALAAGHIGDAQACLRQAQQMFQRIGAAEAITIAAELEALTKAQSAAERTDLSHG
jgi:tetratricopeptide (TPR) repeat protein/transcriptional regulator with XRE-family HTH domain